MFHVNTSSQEELLSCCFIDHVSSSINKLWLLLCYLRVPFHQLASPPRFHVTHSKCEPCIFGIRIPRVVYCLWGQFHELELTQVQWGTRLKSASEQARNTALTFAPLVSPFKSDLLFSQDRSELFL